MVVVLGRVVVDEVVEVVVVVSGRVVVLDVVVVDVVVVLVVVVVDTAVVVNAESGAICQPVLLMFHANM